MRRNQYKSTTLILFILFSFLFSFLMISFNFQNETLPQIKERVNVINPEAANITTPLPYSDIHRNSSEIYRLFETINITVDTSSYSEANYTIMQISFSNGTVRDYDMISVGNNNFSYEYKPTYNAPLGIQNVSFLIYHLNDTMLNTQTTYTNFTIRTNYMANFDSSEYITGDNLYADFILYNFSSYQFHWNISVVDRVNELTQVTLMNLSNHLFQFSFEIDNNTFTQIDRTYFIKVNIFDILTGKNGVVYFPFIIGNSNPIFNSTLQFSSNEVYRAEEFDISLNVSDLETASEDLNIIMFLQDSEGEDVYEVPINYVNGDLFSETFSIPYYRPVGKYRVSVIATDENGGSTTSTALLTVKNNLPEIHDYKINDKSNDQSISIAYGKNLVFSFNVSDTEGVKYIKVALLDENNEWYNITKTYEDIDTEISIRTVELVTGTWYVYLYVIDTDGAVISLTADYDLAPQGIVIIEDIISDYIPWISLFLGLGIGILVGVAGAYKYAKSKFSVPQGNKRIKKEKPTKKSLQKKNDKSKPIKEESVIKEKDTEGLEQIKTEEQESPAKRKIKRKL